MQKDLNQSAKSLRPARPVSPKSPRRSLSRPINHRASATAPLDPSNLSDAAGRLRLVGNVAPDSRPPTENPTPIKDATDPRWVLAIRAADALEGDVLAPTKRETLMNTGKSMGLTAFDCSLILAIVQDRARRGIAPSHCPAAATTQLALVPLPTVRPWLSGFTENLGQAALLAAGVLALQALLLWVWLS